MRRMFIVVIAFILTYTFLFDNTNTYAQPDKTTVATDSLNVRSGPGLSYDVIGSLKRGDKIEVLSSSNDWLRVNYNGQTGWIASWLTFATAEKASKEIVSQTDALNFRASPSVNAPILTRMNAGDKATFINRDDDWIHAEFNGMKGWVHSQYLSEVTVSETQPVNTTVKYETFTVNVDALNVRKKSGLSSNKIGTIHKGESYPIKSIDGNWVQISLSKNKSGWVYSFYGDLSTKNKPSAATESAEIRQVTVLSNGTNIREQATTSSRVMLRANAGEQFTIKEQHGDWFEIALPNGISAFIAKWVVSTQDELIPTSSSNQAKRVPGTLQGVTIVVDAGHGGNDRGTTGVRGTLEKTITLQTADLLSSKLQAAGAKVIMTRNSDYYVSLQKRVAIGHQYQADAFISIHYDASLDSSISGFTTYYHRNNQVAIAKSINNGLQSTISIRNRGAQMGNFHVLRENRQNAVLIELGFLSNPTEEMTINSHKFREQATHGIYKGILNYFN